MKDTLSDTDARLQLTSLLISFKKSVESLTLDTVLDRSLDHLTALMVVKESSLERRLLQSQEKTEPSRRELLLLEEPQRIHQESLLLQPKSQSEPHLFLSRTALLVQLLLPEALLLKFLL